MELYRLGSCSALILTGAARSHTQASILEVSSPDHQTTMRFSVKQGKEPAADPDGQLVYSVGFHGKPAFEDSALRLELGNQPPLWSDGPHHRHHARFRCGRLQAGRRKDLGSA